jgi:RNA exonuclease
VLTRLAGLFARCRFSGITPELLGTAVLDLAAVRQALRAFIGPQTIIVGHALENDLRTLRMVHHRIVDTCVLFPHRAGAPYRRALRDLWVVLFLGVCVCADCFDAVTG